MSTVDVSDLNIHELIKALWRNRQPAAFFNTFDAMRGGAKPPPEPTNQEIDNALQNPYGIDYLNGRGIKVDFKNRHAVNSRLYNRDAGEGEFERIVASMRSK